MKLTNNKKTQLKPGMTLIELTVVILVLLTLISVLFIGAQAYKNAADRSACILNIRNFHQGVRANQNTGNFTEADTIDRTQVVGVGRFVEAEPICPTDGAAAQIAYTLASNYPPVGTTSVQCTTSGGILQSGDIGYDSTALTDHIPTSTSGW